MYKDVICDKNNINNGRTDISGAESCMLLQLSWYPFQLDCYKLKMLSHPHGNHTQKSKNIHKRKCGRNQNGWL